MPATRRARGKCLRQAIALAWAIETADQKIVAEIVITQKHIECGDRDGARDLLKEAIPFALIQAEPLRSRSLAMFVECQVKAGDADGAIETAAAIRDYPGARKAQGLEQSRDVVRKGRRPRDRAELSPAVPANRRGQKRRRRLPPLVVPPAAGKVRTTVERISARSFVDYEHEIDPAI